MATKKVKPARALVNPPAAKAKGVKQPKHPVMVLFQKRNRKGDLRWYQHILAANGKMTSGLTEPDGYASLSAVKRAVKQDAELSASIEEMRKIYLHVFYSKEWWKAAIELGWVVIRKAKK